MGDIERLRALLSRIEKATGPDRLFAEHVVQIVADLGPTSAQDWIAAHGQPHASIDAALALVERCLLGAEVVLSILYDISSYTEVRRGNDEYQKGDGATAPLAILAALLRALIANQQESA